MKYGSDKERTSLVGAQIWPDSAALGSFNLFAPLIFGPPPLLDGDHHLDLDPDDDDDDNKKGRAVARGLKNLVSGVYDSFSDEFC